MPTRIIVTGSRSWPCPDIARTTLASIRSRIGDNFVVVHGDCPTGVDRSFRDACIEMGIEHEPHPVSWDLTGPAGGPARNGRMVSLGAEYAIAAHRSIARSKGTKDCARKCMRAGIPVYLLDGKNPARRLRVEDLEVER